MRGPRKSAPRVKSGAVQKKNNWRETREGEWLEGTNVVFERDRPGKGYRHVLHRSDLERFIALLPDWDELSHGLEAIVLLPGDPEQEGVCFPRWLGINAWPRDLWEPLERSYLERQRESMVRLGVPLERSGDAVIVKWTEETVRAYQLLDVFLHELGHHHDRMSTRSKGRAPRGEGYAERYALRYMDRIFQAYQEEFDFHQL